MATGQPVVLIAGDGGMQVNIQELQTVARNKLPIKIIVLNNGCYGMVRQFQENYLEGRYQSTLNGYSAPNFAAVARAYGIKAACATGTELDEELAWAMTDRDAPYLLDVAINPLANAYPKLAFGRPLSEMEPSLSL